MRNQDGNESESLPELPLNSNMHLHVYRFYILCFHSPAQALLCQLPSAPAPGPSRRPAQTGRSRCGCRRSSRLQGNFGEGKTPAELIPPPRHARNRAYSLFLSFFFYYQFITKQTNKRNKIKREKLTLVYLIFPAKPRVPEPLHCIHRVLVREGSRPAGRKGPAAVRGARCPPAAERAWLGAAAPSVRLPRERSGASAAPAGRAGGRAAGGVGRDGGRDRGEEGGRDGGTEGGEAPPAPPSAAGAGPQRPLPPVGHGVRGNGGEAAGAGRQRSRAEGQAGVSGGEGKIMKEKWGGR